MPSQPLPAARKIVLAYAAFASLWILLSDRVVAWLFREPTSLMLASTLKGWCFVALTSLLLDALLRRQTGAAAHLPSEDRGPFLLLAAGVAALTGAGFAHTVIHHQDREVARLQAIADLKSRQIGDWLNERRGGAEFARSGTLLAEQYRRWQVAGDAAGGASLRAHLERMCTSLNFSAVTLLDDTGRRLWSTDTAPRELAAPPLEAAAAAARDGGVRRVGPYRDKGGATRLDFVAPLRPAVVVLHVAPADWLFPMLQAWPTASTSGETLLFRRDGDDVLFLNELRHRQDAAAKQRISVKEKDLLAAQVLRGEGREGVALTGRDYRGVPVMGVVRAVPGTDWFLVAKMDRAELYGQAFEDAAWIALSGLLALVLAGTAAYLQRQRRELAVAAEIQRVQAGRLRALQLLDAIVAGSTDAIFAKDRDGRYLLANAEVARLAGKTVDNILGCDDTALFPPKEAASLMAHDSSTMVTGRTITLQESFSTAEGTKTFLSTRGPLRDATGRIVGTFGISRDITARCLMEAELLRLQQAVDQSFESIVVTSLNGNIEYVNAAFLRSSGYRREEVLGQNCRLLKSGLTPEATYERMWATLQRGKSWSGEFINRRKDGRTYVEFARISPVRQPDGRISHYLAIKEDVGERKRMEEQRHTLELQLRQAQKMEMIGQLTGGIAHDFNNILAAIFGYAELAQMAPELRQHPRLDLCITEILHAGGRARELISQLLMVSQKTDATTAEPVAVMPIVKESIKLLRAALPATISLETALADDLPDATIGAVHLHQILMNLGINARDSIRDRGAVTIGARLLHMDRIKVCDSCHRPFAGSYLMIWVTDTGHGIAPEHRTNIFDPFFTTKNAGKGSGLGLSVLHGIVHSAGGHVTVTSAPQAGTEFRIYLPAQAHGPEPAPQEAGAPGTSLHGHVLVVDDEPSLVRYLTALLEGFGCRVTGLTSAAEALELFRRRPQEIDLVVADQTMPDLTGAELARAMLALRPELPVILCTGYSNVIDEAEARRIGICRFLMKPVPAGVLAGAIAECLAEPPEPTHIAISGAS